MGWIGNSWPLSEMSIRTKDNVTRAYLENVLENDADVHFGITGQLVHSPFVEERSPGKIRIHGIDVELARDDYT